MMDERQMRIAQERLKKAAVERELVSQLTSSRAIRLKNQNRADLLRSRIAELNRRIVQLKRDHPDR
jgi:hypothetical protein